MPLVLALFLRRCKAGPAGQSVIRQAGHHPCRTGSTTEAVDGRVDGPVVIDEVVVAVVVAALRWRTIRIRCRCCCCCCSKMAYYQNIIILSKFKKCTYLLTSVIKNVNIVYDDDDDYDEEMVMIMMISLLY